MLVLSLVEKQEVNKGIWGRIRLSLGWGEVWGWSQEGMLYSEQEPRQLTQGPWV